jgi:hypothetical protein
MKLEDWDESRRIINEIIKDDIKNRINIPARCIFCGTEYHLNYLKWVDDLVCEECRKRILE